MAKATTTRKPAKRHKLKKISGENPSADDAGERAGGGSVEALGHAAREVGFAAGDYGVAHGFRHEDGVLGFGDGRIHEDAIGTEFHGDGGVGSGADAGIHDHGNFGDAFAEDAEVGGILHAEAGSDGRGKRHDGGGAGVDEFAGGDQIIIGVGEYDEALLDEDASGLDELLSVREKSLLVADDFELDPIREADFAGQARSANGFIGGVAGGGVGKNKNLFAVDVIQK